MKGTNNIRWLTGVGSGLAGQVGLELARATAGPPQLWRRRRHVIMQAQWRIGCDLVVVARSRLDIFLISRL